MGVGLQHSVQNQCLEYDKRSPINATKYKSLGFWIKMFIWGGIVSFVSKALAQMRPSFWSEALSPFSSSKMLLRLQGEPLGPAHASPFLHSLSDLGEWRKNHSFASFGVWWLQRLVYVETLSHVQQHSDWATRHAYSTAEGLECSGWVCCSKAEDTDLV